MTATTSDDGMGSTLETFCDELDERLALAIGIECGWTQTTYDQLDLSPSTLTAIKDEYHYYLGGLYAGRLYRVFSRVFNRFKYVPDKTQHAFFNHPSQVHAFIAGVDIGWTGGVVSSLPVPLQNDILFAPTYYEFGEVTGGFARSLVLAINLWFKVKSTIQQNH